MHIRKLLALVLLGLSLTAAADFTTITAAYEVTVSDLRLPGAAGGTLTFKECPDCEAKTVRVNSRTRYVLNDRDLELAEFKKKIGNIRRPRDETATVLHHLESNTITAIKVRL
jgi:Ribonuclease G/E